MTYNKELADRFVKWKDEQQLSFEDLALYFGKSKGHLYKFSKDKIGISYELGKSIEEAIENWNYLKTAEIKRKKFLAKYKKGEMV